MHIYFVLLDQDIEYSTRFIVTSDSEEFCCRSLPVNYVRLDQDILSPLAGKKQLYIYETNDFWEQIKTPG